jgi:hypothetical protein
MTYRLDREDFKAWLFERKQNLRPGETLRDREGSQKPRKTLRDLSETR